MRDTLGAGAAATCIKCGGGAGIVGRGRYQSPNALKRSALQPRHKWAGGRLYNAEWARVAIADERERRLLESEWNLRLVVLGRRFVASLVLGDLAHRQKCEQVLDSLKQVHCWAKGQARSADYEAVLHGLLPGYDSTSKGMLNYRPDFIVEPFVPCAATAAISAEIDAIHAAIQRRAHVFEFTAQRSPSEGSIRSYLAGKLGNYVQITQEQ